MQVRVAILTISDRASKGERADESGPALVNAAQLLGWGVCRVALVPDEMKSIQDTLKTWSDSGDVDVILTTGGTGFAPRDITPEATLSIIDRRADGLAEAMRAASLRITPHAMLSRAAAGIRKKTVIVNLPGSPKAALENFSTIASVLPHAIELLHDSASAEKNHQIH